MATKHLILFMLSLMLLASGACGAGNIIWQHYSKDEVIGGPVAADIGESPGLEVVYSSQKELVVLDAYGDTLWTYCPGGTISTPPRVSEGHRLIFFGTSSGSFYAVGYNASLVWEFFAGSEVTSPALVSRIGVNRRLQRKDIVAFGCKGGEFYLLDMMGTPMYNYTASGALRLMPSVSDLDRNALEEVIFASEDNRIYAIEYPTGKKWIYSFADDPATPAQSGGKTFFVGTIGGDLESLYESSYTEDNVTYSQINQNWKKNIEGKIESFLAAGDLDGDKKTEVALAFDQKGWQSVHRGIMIINSSGGVEVTYTVNGRILSAPHIEDLNADKVMELTLATTLGHVYVLSANGSARASYSVQDSFSSSPMSCDPDGDGVFEVVAASVGNMIYLFGDPRDSDSDGVCDYSEHLMGTDPFESDTDSDGIPDRDDYHPLVHEMALLDSDDDGVDDYMEMLWGSDPLSIDTDGDGLNDSVDPNVLDHELSFKDSDRDGVDDYNESLLGSNPQDSDTDGDGFKDNEDPHILVHELSLVDSDLDGLSDLEELELGSDPYFNDTDSDGILDSEDPHILESEEMLKYYGVPEETQKSDGNATIIFAAAMSGMLLVAKKASGQRILSFEEKLLQNEIEGLHEEIERKRQEIALLCGDDVCLEGLSMEEQVLLWSMLSEENT